MSKESIIKKAGGSGNPAFLIPVLWKIYILLHKKATRTKHFGGKCSTRISVNIKANISLLYLPYVDIYVDMYM